MAAELQLNPTQPVNQQIYRILRHDIVHCLIPPGTPLSRKKCLCVLAFPANRCVRLLSNWLRMVLFKFVRGGSYVNKISLSQVRNGCFVRRAIECAVVRRAAGMITAEQIYQRGKILTSSVLPLSVSN